MSKTEILKGKTPVTLLQELCAKSKCSLPMYQFLDEEILPHGPNMKLFTHMVSAMGKNAKGVGRSKQESKHEAAWQLIRLVLNLPPDEEDDMVAAAGERGSLAAIEIGTDRVSQVRDICIQRNFPLPEFELVRNYGPSHAPVFEYECRIRDIVRRGVHATKKGAKQIACQEMIKTLQSMPVEDTSLQVLSLDQAIEDMDEINDNVIRTYREYTQSDNKKKLGVSIADRHTFFLELPQERINEGRRLLLDQNESEREKCMQIAAALGLKSKILIANPNLPMIKGSHMSTFELLSPDFDCFIIGVGESFYTKVCEYFVRMLNIQQRDPAAFPVLEERVEPLKLIVVDTEEETSANDHKDSCDYTPAKKIQRFV